MHQVLLDKKGTRIYLNNTFCFQEWKNSSKLFLGFLVSNTHFENKLHKIKQTLKARLFAIAR